MLEGLEAWGPGPFLRTSVWLYPLLNAGHILSIGLLVGSALLMDLRLVGLFGRRFGIDIVLGLLRPVAMSCLVLAIITGALLFTVQPRDYVENPAFVLKLGLVCLATINAIGFTLLWRGEATMPPRLTMLLRLMAIGSILLWAGALVAGRYIGFLN